MTARPIAVVLSGGGAKTAAHLGACRAVKEAGFEPAWYVATSMGAVIAAGLASGVGNDEMLERIAQLGGRSIVRDPLAAVAGLFSRSLLKPAPLRQAIEELVPARRFADLTVPLTVTAVDLDTGELVLFGAGAQVAPLVDVLCASCALPMYYPPVVLGGRRYGDGGLRGVVPLEPAAELDVELVRGGRRGSRLRRASRRSRPESPRWFGPTTTRSGSLWLPTPRASSRYGARTRPVPHWSTSGPGSSATPPSGWTGCASTPAKDAAPPARRWITGAGTLDPSSFQGKLSQ